MENLLDLIQQARQEYEVLNPDPATYNFQIVKKYDVFGQPIEEVGSLDQLAAAQHKENYQEEKEKWVFQKVLEQIDESNFADLVAIMGNPGRLNPCDGPAGQCTFFCENFTNCPYQEKKPKKESKSENTEIHSAGGKRNNNKRPGSKSTKRKKSKK